MHIVGDRVTVIDTQGQNPKTLGRTGTVTLVDNNAQLVCVAGIDNRIIEHLFGERAYRPNQLRTT